MLEQNYNKIMNIQKAKSLAYRLHEGQTRADGITPYIEHPKKVAELAATLQGDEKTGAQIVLKALEAPLFHIAANAGLEGSVIVNKIRESEVGTGFNVLSEQYVDMVTDGILDPAKVTRSALQNAASIASMVLTTESLVADKPEEKGCGCGAHGDMPAGMDGMY